MNLTATRRLTRLILEAIDLHAGVRFTAEYDNGTCREGNVLVGSGIPGVKVSASPICQVRAAPA